MAQRETGLRKAGALPADRRGWKCSWGGRAVCEVRKDELCHHLNPSCCFSNEGPAFGHWRVPESMMRRGCSTADIPPSQGTAQKGSKDDFMSGKGRSKCSPGGTAPAISLAVPPCSVATEPGFSLAWRHLLPLSGDKELKPGGSWKGSGLLGKLPWENSLVTSQRRAPHPRQRHHSIRVTTMVRKSS